MFGPFVVHLIWRVVHLFALIQTGPECTLSLARKEPCCPFNLACCPFLGPGPKKARVYTFSLPAEALLSIKFRLLSISWFVHFQGPRVHFFSPDGSPVVHLIWRVVHFLFWSLETEKNARVYTPGGGRTTPDNIKHGTFYPYLSERLGCEAVQVSGRYGGGWVGAIACTVPPACADLASIVACLATAALAITASVAKQEQ